MTPAETIARVLLGDGIYDLLKPELRELVHAAADAVMAKHEAMLSEQGFAIVPREPSDAMLNVEISSRWEWTGDFNRAARKHIYQAMIAESEK